MGAAKTRLRSGADNPSNQAKKLTSAGSAAVRARTLARKRALCHSRSRSIRLASGIAVRAYKLELRMSVERGPKSR